jgi:hypothetical protein
MPLPDIAALIRATALRIKQTSGAKMRRENEIACLSASSL